MSNDHRDDGGWENAAVERGGDRFHDEVFTSGGLFNRTKSGGGGAGLFGGMISVVIILCAIVFFIYNFKGCSIGSVKKIDEHTYVTKTAMVKIRHNYHLPWGDKVAVAESEGFRGFLNLESGQYKFYFTNDESRFENETKGTAQVLYNASDGYSFKGGPVNGKISNIVTRWGRMTVKIKLDFEVKD